jgi:hypothetical protein
VSVEHTEGPRFASAISPATGALPRFVAAALSALFSVAVLTAAAPVAGAAVIHELQTSWPGITQPSGIAVDQSNGDVYVVEGGSGNGPMIVKRFDSNGNPKNFSALGSPPGSTNVIDGTDNGLSPADADAVPGNVLAADGVLAFDNSGGVTDGDLYVPTGNGGGIRIFDRSGRYLGSITGPNEQTFSFACGVGVDSAGRVFASDGFYGVLNRFTPESNPVVNYDNDLNFPTGEFCRIAVSSTDMVYLGGYNGGPLVKYDATEASPTQVFISGETTGIAIDPTNDDVYSVEGGKVVRRDSQDNVLESFGSMSTTTSPASGVGVYPAEGKVFASDTANERIDVYVSRYVPNPVSGAATSVARTTATLHGEVDLAGNGAVTACHFDYGTDTSYGQTAPCNPGAPYNSNQAVSSALSGLSAQTTYHYRLVATNAEGTNVGLDQTFTTQNAVVGVATAPATGVTRHTATLNGSFDPDGVDTHYFFEWGTDTSYGNMTAAPPGVDAGSTPGTVSESAPISGLSVETTYHFRLVATNSFGTTVGEDQSFTTPSAVAAATTDEASSIAVTSATLNGSFDANGEDTHYFFEWGPDTSYGNVTAASPGADGGSQPGTTHIAAPLTGLHYYTRYHFRLVTSNPEGVTTGADRDFVTLPPPPPAILASSASVTSPTQAMLKTTVNPELADTVVRFQYGESTDYGQQSFTTESIGSDEVPHSVETMLSNLEPGTTYHFRTVSINFGGTSYGPDRTFTTPGPPRAGHASADSISASSATIHAQIESGLTDTTYYVEYGTSAAYGARTPSVALAGSAAGSPVMVVLSGLGARTSYHYRVVASNSFGAVATPDQAFTTGAAAVSPSPPPSPCRKGFVRRHGKCVKKKRAKRHHHTRGSRKHG